jgi:hypothetical protein
MMRGQRLSEARDYQKPEIIRSQRLSEAKDYQKLAFLACFGQNQRQFFAYILAHILIEIMEKPALISRPHLPPLWVKPIT